MAQRIIAVADTHCQFDVLEQIVSLELERHPSLVAVFHCGDLGLFDKDQLDRLPDRERALTARHKNPVEQFSPYLAGEKKFRLPVYAIAGNHEDFALVVELERGVRAVPNLRLLRPGELLQVTGTSFDIMGLGRTLPLGLAPRNRKREKIIQPEHLAATLAAAESHQPTFLLLHETPYLTSTSGRSYGHPQISSVIQKLKPKRTLTGHIHKEFRAILDGTPIFGLGYGVAGRYALINDQLDVQFRDLAARDVDVIEMSPGDVTRIPPEREGPLTARRERFLTARDIVAHFRLDLSKRSVTEHLQALSRMLCEKQDAGEIQTQQQAIETAETYLKARGVL